MGVATESDIAIRRTRVFRWGCSMIFGGVGGLCHLWET